MQFIKGKNTYTEEHGVYTVETVITAQKNPDTSYLGRFSFRPTNSSIECGNGMWFNASDSEHRERAYERMLSFMQKEWTLVSVHMEVVYRGRRVAKHSQTGIESDIPAYEMQALLDQLALEAVGKAKNNVRRIEQDRLAEQGIAA